MSVPHIDDVAVDRLLSLSSIYGAVNVALKDWGNGDAANTIRVRASAKGQMASAMAAVAPPYSGGKVYATKDGVFTFLNVLFDDQGNLLCTLDGDVLTRLRTPVLCQIAIEKFAPINANKGAIIGAGRQGRLHLEMMIDSVKTLESINIYDPRNEAAQVLVDLANSRGIAAQIAKTPSAAIDGAQIVVTLTPATEPLFEAEEVNSEALICAVGSTKYDKCELPPKLMARAASVVCDDVEGSKIECGDLIRAVDEGFFSWGNAIEFKDVCADKIKTPRANKSIVVFETQGLALQDVAAAGVAWEKFKSELIR
jgi:ornithine cyclodeaminase/alanine dehydrogenase-like protein (mu-crystallin family)